LQFAHPSKIAQYIQLEVLGAFCILARVLSCTFGSCFDMKFSKIAVIACLELQLFIVSHFKFSMANSFYDMHLQEIMVVVFIILDWIFVLELGIS